MPANDLYLTARDAAKILNVSERSIHDYKKRGIPKTDDKQPKYPGREIVLWGIENGVIDYSVSSIEEDLENIPPKERKDLAEARLKELELAKKKGELISIDEIRKENEYVLTAFKNKSLAIPSKIAPALVGIENTAEIQAILEKAVHELLIELATIENI